MTRFGVVPVLLAAGLAPAIAQIRATPVWDGFSVPVTIEVEQDVPVEREQRGGQKRGSLYSDKVFRISKGQRFQMIEILQEGGCRIVFENSQHELSTCPWLPGARDSQSDIFRIVEFRNR